MSDGSDDSTQATPDQGPIEVTVRGEVAAVLEAPYIFAGLEEEIWQAHSAWAALDAEHWADVAAGLRS